MLLLNCFYKIFIIFFIAIRCAFALHDNPIFYQAEQLFIHGSFDEAQQLLSQITQDHLLKKALLTLIKNPNAPDKKITKHPLKKLSAAEKRTLIYIDVLVRNIADNTVFLWIKQNTRHKGAELYFKESCQALDVCFRVACEWNHQQQEITLTKKLEEFCQLASTFIDGNVFEQFLGDKMLSTITNIFYIPRIDRLYANYLTSQYEVSIQDNQQCAENAKKLYLRLSNQDMLEHNSFYSISYLYWKQLQYEQFFLWFSKSVVHGNSVYSTLNQFISKKTHRVS